ACRRRWWREPPIKPLIGVDHAPVMEALDGSLPYAAAVELDGAPDRFIEALPWRHPAPAHALCDDLGHRADAEGSDRRAAGHRLDHDEAERLWVGERIEERSCSGQQLVAARGVHHAHVADEPVVDF